MLDGLKQLKNLFQTKKELMTLHLISYYNSFIFPYQVPEVHFEYIFSLLVSLTF